MIKRDSDLFVLGTKTEFNGEGSYVILVTIPTRFTNHISLTIAIQRAPHGPNKRRAGRGMAAQHRAVTTRTATMTWHIS